MKLEIKRMFMNEAGAGGAGGGVDIKIDYATVEAACTTINNCLESIEELCSKGISVTSYTGAATSEIETWIVNLQNDLKAASSSKMQEIRSNLDTVRQAYIDWEESTRSAFQSANAKHSSSNVTSSESKTGNSINMVQ